MIPAARRIVRGLRAPVIATLVAVLVAGALSAAATAQAPGQPSPDAAPAAEAARDVGTEDLEALLATLQDETERAKLEARIRALIAARKAEQERPPEAAGLTDALSNWISGLSQEVVAAAQTVVNAPVLLRELGRIAADEEARLRALEVAAKIVLVLALGFAAEWAARRVLARPRRALGARAIEGVLLRWASLLSRTALDVVPILAFAAAAYGVLPFTDPGPATRSVALALINASVLARAVLVLALMVFSPSTDTLRVWRLSDETANYAYLWVRRLANTGIYGYFAVEAGRLLGLPARGYETLLNVLGLAIAAMLAILILQTRQAVSARLRGREEGSPPKGSWRALRRLFAEVWHVLAILYVVALYFVWALRLEGGFKFVVTATVLTVVIAAAAQLVAGAARRLIDRGFAVSDELKARFPTLEARANRYVPVLHVTARVFIYGISAMALFQVWGFEALAWFGSDVGRQFTVGAISIIFVVLLAIVLWEVASLFIERYLARLEGAAATVGRAARLKTLLPLFRNVLMVVLVTVVSLMVLSELGINIAPLLAGAGVIGLAIGFGAQKLVQDVITGLFILIEDTLQVGDVVTLGSDTGIVEGMTIRSIRLRDLEGTVHTVPFSSVSTVLNMTKDFSYYLMNMGVAYRENVDHVIQVMREIGDEMQRDETYGPLILEPLEVLGLDKFADSAIVIKARIKTLPIKQWFVGREFNRRMKARFDELGIEIPFPHQTIYFGEDKLGRAPPLRLRTEEAEEIEEAPPRPGGQGEGETQSQKPEEPGPGDSLPGDAH